MSLSQLPTENTMKITTEVQKSYKLQKDKTTGRKDNCRGGMSRILR